MSDEKPWGVIDPNSQHQLWSRWTVAFESPEQRVIPSVQEIADNARRFFAQLFNSTVGRVKVETKGQFVEIVCEIEGPAAHDPALRESAIDQIRRNFTYKGFGQIDASVTVGVLAGDMQDGKPPAQLIVMPNVVSSSELYTL